MGNEIKMLRNEMVWDGKWECSAFFWMILKRGPLDGVAILLLDFIHEILVFFI